MTATKLRKRLPWTYYEALGWGGERLDEARARKIVERVGLDAASNLGDTPLTVAAVLGRIAASLGRAFGGGSIAEEP